MNVHHARHVHEDISQSPTPILINQYPADYVVSSTYLNRRKPIRSIAKADAQLSGSMGDWGSQNVTFRNEPLSLCLRILSPSTWTRTR